MFSLAYGFFEWLTSKEELKCLIVGLDRGGKSTILEHLKCTYLADHRPISKNLIPATIGMNLGRMPICNYDVTLWDVGGMVRGRPRLRAPSAWGGDVCALRAWAQSAQSARYARRVCRALARGVRACKCALWRHSHTLCSLCSRAH